MKKLFALLLCLMMVLPMASLAEEKVDITLWTYPIGNWTNAETVDAIIANFNAVYPNISVTVQYLDYQSGDDQVTSAIEAGTTPDIIMEGPERLVTNWGAAGKMLDLSDLWTEEALADISATSEAVVAACKGVDGKYYEYPLCMTTHCMVIDRAAFEAADALQYLDEETRTWTTDGFVSALRALTEAGFYPTGIVYCGGQGGDQGTRALVNNLYSDYFVTEDGSSYNANSANNVKALELLQSMVADGSLSANASFQASDELQAFANQTCAVTFCWNYSNYGQYASQTQFTPYAVAFPSDDGEPELEMAGPYGFCVFDNGDDARAEAAKTFIKFICDDPETGVLAAQTTGFFPVHADWGDIYADAEDADIRAPFSLMGNYVGRYYNLTGGWTEQRALWWPLLTDIMLNGADVQTAADEYVAEANANIG